MRTAIKRTILLVGLPALAVAVVSFGALTRGTRPEIPPGPTPANEAEALATWESVLETYVDERGRVDFAGLSGDRGRIEAYLRWVADADTSRMGEEERLAFRINAYNALAMYGVVRAGILEDFGSIWEKVRFFVVPKHGRLVEFPEEGRGWREARRRRSVRLERPPVVRLGGSPRVATLPSHPSACARYPPRSKSSTSPRTSAPSSGSTGWPTPERKLLANSPSIAETPASAAADNIPWAKVSRMPTRPSDASRNIVTASGSKGSSSSSTGSRRFNAK